MDMSHATHLHGHVFQVTEIDGQGFPGATRNTVLVLPRQPMEVPFDAIYPEHRMMYYHIPYHQAYGMITVLQYQGFEDQNYYPLASRARFKR